MTSISLAEFNSINKQASNLCYIAVTEVIPGYYKDGNDLCFMSEVTEIDEPSGILCYVGICFKVI